MTNLNQNSKPDWLVLIPTNFERELIGDRLTVPNHVIEVCGFGAVVPAARTIQLIQAHQPNRVLLIGIAGSYDEMLTPGTAFSFTQVACYGVGVGSGSRFQTAQEMGWAHWPSTDPNEIINEVVPIEPVKQVAAQLLTVCASSENENDVRDRLGKFPESVAEDMEGFAVAAACRLAGVPVSIIRGISNRAGDRDKVNWKIADALSAAIELANDSLSPKAEAEN